MTASASMPPTPQPSTPRPLIMVVCESVPTTESGYKRPSWLKTTRARYSRLTWWTIPDPGGTINMFWNAWAPHWKFMKMFNLSIKLRDTKWTGLYLEEDEAFLVPFKLQILILIQRISPAWKKKREKTKKRYVSEENASGRLHNDKWTDKQNENKQAAPSVHSLTAAILFTILSNGPESSRLTSMQKSDANI